MSLTAMGVDGFGSFLFASNLSIERDTAVQPCSSVASDILIETQKKATKFVGIKSFESCVKYRDTIDCKILICLQTLESNAPCRSPISN